MLRITGGLYRGRLILTPSHDQTRPTQAKLRQALFNSIQSIVPDAQVLDLFAGSGVLGFEALSRGAAAVVFVEQLRSVAHLIERNSVTLQTQNAVQILVGSVFAMVSEIQKKGPFHLIFADPPYVGGFESQLLTQFPWSKMLHPEGYLCLEWGRKKSGILELPTTSCLVKVREKDYGDSTLSTYRKQ
jgi:16S rRNA (guanine966-N2)-methyltransferase